MLALVRPAASPQRRPAKAPDNTMALYWSGMASTSCSTSDWERNRGGLSGSEGSGTLIAGLIAIRLSAIAASRHWRSAKTALRIVEGERPAGPVPRKVLGSRNSLLTISRDAPSRTAYGR